MYTCLASVKLNTAKINRTVREIDESSIIVEEFNSQLEMDRYIKQNINKTMVELNIIINQVDVIDFYRLLH